MHFPKCRGKTFTVTYSTLSRGDNDASAMAPLARKFGIRNSRDSEGLRVNLALYVDIE